MTALANITTVFLRKEYTDLRKDSLSMLIDHKSWKEILNTTSLSIVEEIGDDITYGGFSYFGLINNGNSSVTVKNSSFISEHIRNMVPEYMIPKHYIFLSRVPMSANGKIDRKALLAMRNDADNEEADDEVKYTKTEERLSEIWRGKKTAEVKQKIAEIESLITEKQETLDMQKDLFLDAKQEQLTKLSKLDEFDEEVIRYLIDYVLVYDNEHIEIRWNFDDFQAG